MNYNQNAATPPKNPRHWNTLAYFCLLLCLVGLAVSFSLAKLHFRVHTDPHFHSFCNLGNSFNCETVAESPYSVFLGLPLAIWGIIGYLVMFAVILGGIRLAKAAAAWTALFLLSAFATVCSLALALVSYCIICSFCLLCTFLYLTNLLLLGVSFWQLRKNQISFKISLRQIALWSYAHWWLGWLVLLAVAMLCVTYPKYWIDSIRKTGLAADQGFTADGHPWIGAPHPKLVITEYSDYFCPHCRRGHANIRKLLADNPGVFQVIHRNYPLDNECNPMVTRPFHIGACLLARAAYCAGEQKKFWDMNDVLYQYETLAGDDWTARSKDAALIAKLNMGAFEKCLNSPAASASVKTDIEAGAQHKLLGTPAYVINDKLYLGTLPNEVIDQYLSKPAAPAPAPQ